MVPDDDVWPHRAKKRGPIASVEGRHVIQRNLSDCGELGVLACQVLGVKLRDGSFECVLVVEGDVRDPSVGGCLTDREHHQLHPRVRGEA